MVFIITGEKTIYDTSTGILYQVGINYSYYDSTGPSVTAFHVSGGIEDEGSTIAVGDYAFAFLESIPCQGMADFIGRIQKEDEEKNILFRTCSFCNHVSQNVADVACWDDELCCKSCYDNFFEDYRKSQQCDECGRIDEYCNCDIPY